MIGPTMMPTVARTPSSSSPCGIRRRRAMWFTHPVGMNSAVMSPQAMNAPRFGMIMPARKAPKRWTAARGPVPVTVGVYADIVLVTPL